MFDMIPTSLQIEWDLRKFEAQFNIAQAAISNLTSFFNMIRRENGI